MLTSIELLFAGAWAYVWHWGTMVALMVIFLVLALAADWVDKTIPVLGPFLGKVVRKDFLFGAFGCALVIGGMYVGVHDASGRCKAKQIVVEKSVSKAVTKSLTAPSRPGKWETTQ